jgi:hypothetical protein
MKKNWQVIAGRGEVMLKSISSDVARLNSWQSHQAELEAYAKRRDLLYEKIGGIFSNPIKLEGGDYPTDLAAIRHTPSAEAVAEYIEMNEIDILLGSYDRMKRGSNWGIPEKGRMLVRINQPGVVTKKGVGRLGPAFVDGAHVGVPITRTAKVAPVGAEYCDPIVRLNTEPMLGGRLIIANLLHATIFEGLVDPTSAEPRVSLEVYRPTE